MIETDALDDRIVRTLEKRTQTTRELVRILRIGRTTLRYRLLRLQKKGLIQNKKADGSRDIIWSHTYARVRGKRSVEIYEGSKYYLVYTALWKLKKGSTVYNVVASRAIQAVLSNAPQSFFIKSQKTYKKKQLLIKGLFDENCFNLADVFSPEFLKAHAGRKIIVKIISEKEKFEGYGECIATKECVILINTKQRRAVLIRDKQIVELMYALLRLIHNLSDNPSVIASVADPNGYIARKMKEASEAAESK